MRELVPNAKVIALLANPSHPQASVQIGALQAAAPDFGGQSE